MRNLKTRLGYLARIFIYAYRLPRYIRHFEKQAAELRLQASQNDLLIQKAQNKLDQILPLRQATLKIDERVSRLTHKLNTYEDHTVQSARQAGPEPLLADDRLLDSFYKDFEDKFRGSEASVENRLAQYLHLFKSVDFVHENPVVDLGCGRGELLGLLHRNNIRVIGVDLNKNMVKRAKEKGFTAVQGDAITYIASANSNSLAAITGFHLVEHIPFRLLMKLFEESYRALAMGGFVLFETPNPENVMVGACNFYMDPSHLNPIPPGLLAFALEVCGFAVEIIKLHPVMETIEHDDDLVKNMANHFFGPRDYAVIGRKHKL